MRPTLIATLALCAAASAAAQAPDLPRWELGAAAFGVSQQAYPGADQQVGRVLVLPFFVYRGEVLRADRGGFGLRAVKTPDFEVDVGFAGAFGSNSNDIEARRGMPDLGTLVEFGPRLKWNLGAGPGGGRWSFELPARGVFDLSDGLRNRGFTTEPELKFARRGAGGWAYTASAGAVFGNRKIGQTFYEVAPAFATSERAAYEARAGLLAWRLGALATRSLGPDWRLFGFARVDSVAGAANRASPLVRQTTGASVGIGLSWTWMRSEQAAAD
jgi:outer membrane protein